jgi:hypothetical protein
VAPASNARNVLNGLPGAGVVAVPLRDANPTVLSLVWRRDNRNPLLGQLVAAARTIAEGPEPARDASSSLA